VRRPATARSLLVVRAAGLCSSGVTLFLILGFLILGLRPALGLIRRWLPYRFGLVVDPVCE
jgi:hypothetical protein